MQQANTINKNAIWKVLLIALIIPFTMAFHNPSASARSFGGHSTFHSSFHTSPARSYHAPSSTKSYHTYHAPSSTHRTYSTNRDSKNTTVNHYHTTHYGGNSYHRGNSFGHSFSNGIGQGLGWSLGSNVGNSIWHHAFGYGSDQYYDNSGHVQYGHRGYFGWVILLIIILAVIYFIRRHNKNNRY